jgi:hypothetical protein
MLFKVGADSNTISGLAAGARHISRGVMRQLPRALGRDEPQPGSNVSRETLSGSGGFSTSEGWNVIVT